MFYCPTRQGYITQQLGLQLIAHNAHIGVLIIISGQLDSTWGKKISEGCEVRTRADVRPKDLKSSALDHSANPPLIYSFQACSLYCLLLLLLIKNKKNI